MYVAIRFRGQPMFFVKFIAGMRSIEWTADKRHATKLIDPASVIRTAKAYGYNGAFVYGYNGAFVF